MAQSQGTTPPCHSEPDWTARTPGIEHMSEASRWMFISGVPLILMLIAIVLAIVLKYKRCFRDGFFTEHDQKQLSRWREE